MMTKTISGIAASSGIAIAKAYVMEHREHVIETKTVQDIEQEIVRFEAAVGRAVLDLEGIRDRAVLELGEEEAEVFSGHLLVLQDPELIDSAIDRIRTERINAEKAMSDSAAIVIQMFEQMDNDYMKERAADIRDVSNRVISHLMGITIFSPANITEEVIVIADDLTPSDTAQLNRKFVKGFATNIGGRTSHSAIMSRSLEIPAVVGTQFITEHVESGTVVIIDGLEGLVILDPSIEELLRYRDKQKAFEAQKLEWAKLKNSSTQSKDGHHVELAANIGTPDDLQGVLDNGAEGVGLYRTEFLYMGRSELPSEEEQYKAYQTVLQRMEEKPVVIRTLDIGGDKELPYLHLPKEMNPFLGFRAIRLCLEEQEVFRIQLRALLRASAFGNLKIMFPMIATLGEFRRAKAILEEEKKVLIEQGISVSDKIEVGIMVEIPSTAVLADQFAKEVDFFSIGTNDLIQYTMASDRMNEKVASLYQPYNPAILRLIRMVIRAAHKEKKWVGMCGEMAGDSLAIPLLLGLGLDEFSMSASSILPARSQLLKLSKSVIESTLDEILDMGTAEEVEQYVKQRFMVQNAQV